MYYGTVAVEHGKKGRIGIKYDPVHHRVVHVYKDTPAEEAGLRKGDIILKIDDKDIVGDSYTLIHLTIQRGRRIFTVEVERVPCELISEKQTVNEDPEDIEIDQTVIPETA